MIIKYDDLIYEVLIDEDGRWIFKLIYNGENLVKKFEEGEDV